MIHPLKDAFSKTTACHLTSKGWVEVGLACGLDTGPVNALLTSYLNAKCSSAKLICTPIVRPEAQPCIRHLVCSELEWHCGSWHRHGGWDPDTSLYMSSGLLLSCQTVAIIIIRFCWGFHIQLFFSLIPHHNPRRYY